MFKGKAKGPGLHSNPRGKLEDRLEANAFLADISTACGLGTTAQFTDGSDIGFGKSVFIGINNDLIWGDRECERWIQSFRLSKIVGRIFRVLNELVYEPGVFGVKLFG